jgi:hypothetical protein
MTTDALPAGRYEILLHVIRPRRAKGKVWWQADATELASGYRFAFLIFGVASFGKLNSFARMKLGAEGCYYPDPARRYSGQAGVELSFDPKHQNNLFKTAHPAANPSDNPSGVVIPPAAAPVGIGDTRSAALDFGHA